MSPLKKSTKIKIKYNIVFPTSFYVNWITCIQKDQKYRREEDLEVNNYYCIWSNVIKIFY